MKFRYKAYREASPRDIVEDVLEAGSMPEAEELLRRLGLVRVELEADTGKSGIDLGAVNRLFDRVKPQDLVYFTRQLAVMTEASMNPLEALRILENTTRSQLLSEAIAEIRSDISRGMTFAGAMRHHPKIFKDMYVAMVDAGEQAGELAQVLRRLALMEERAYVLRKQVRSAMVYPAVVLAMSFVVFMAMMIFVIPAFQGIFKENGAALPSLTQALVTISDWIRSAWFLIPVIVIGAIVSVRMILNTPEGRRAYDSVRLKLPWKFGRLYDMILTARVFRSLSTLLESGVPVVRALEMTSRASGNVVAQLALMEVASEIERGRQIGPCFRDSGIFPEMATGMLIAGEESGELKAMLSKLADIYEEEVAIMIASMKSLIEPIMIGVIGGIVGVTVVALYLPIFKIYDQIK